MWSSQKQVLIILHFYRWGQGGIKKSGGLVNDWESGKGGPTHTIGFLIYLLQRSRVRWYYSPQMLQSLTILWRRWLFLERAKGEAEWWQNSGPKLETWMFVERWSMQIGTGTEAQHEDSGKIDKMLDWNVNAAPAPATPWYFSREDAPTLVLRV